MSVWSSHPQVAMTPGTPFQRSYLPCLPAPVYRRPQGSRSPLALPRPSPVAPPTTFLSLQQLPMGLSRTATGVPCAGEPTVLRLSPETPGAVSSHPEAKDSAGALPRWEGGAEMESKVDSNCKLEADPKSELQPASGSPGPDSNPRTEAGLQAELQPEFGRPGSDSDPGSEAGLQAELQPELGRPGPDSNPRTEAGLQAELQPESGGPRLDSDPGTEEAGQQPEPRPESGGPGSDSDPGTEEAGQQPEPRWSAAQKQPKPPRKRAVFSAHQISTLEREFQRAPYPAYEDRAQLGMELSITEPQVRVWFQNRRRKLKKQPPK